MQERTSTSRSSHSLQKLGNDRSDGKWHKLHGCNRGAMRVFLLNVGLLLFAFSLHNTASFSLRVSSSASYRFPTSRSWIIHSQSTSFIGSKISTIGSVNPTTSHARSFLMMGGTKDGKQNRKKLSDSATPSQPAPAPTPSAPRVSTDINISVRRQILYGRLNKQLRAGGTSSFRQKKVEKTKYRRTWDEEEIEQKAEERRRKGQV